MGTNTDRNERGYGMKTYYTVVVYAQNSWNGDGSHIMLYESGTKHRSIRTANKKLRELVAYNPRTKTWAAKWHNATIVAVDENGYRSLNTDEIETLYWVDR